MGRLFWKFFLFIWLGQMAAVAGTGALFWLERQAHEAPGPERHGPGEPPDFRGPPPPHRGPPPDKRHGPFRLPLLPAIAGLLASIGCTAGVAWYFAKPIRRLRDGFGQVAGGRMDVRLAPAMEGRRDELADLGMEFDQMTERLQAVIEGQKRLLHDVSHELRSPLARLQAAVGLARQQPEGLEASLQRIERESERMNQLVGELLTLSRLDSGVAGEQEAVDLGDLLADLIDDARFEGERKQVAIDYIPGETAEAMANSVLLHRAIENVVRNALHYSPPGSTIRVEAGKCAADRFAIRIADQGPGVPAAELASIFSPFFRGTAARGNDGYGLGLAIARRVLAACGGTIGATNGKAGGLVVEIELPC